MMKTAVITGTSRGIGRALVKKFLDEGFQVIGTAVSDKTDINDPKFEVVKLDLSKAKSIEKAAKNISHKTSQIDVLINNSGINLEDWDVVDMNVSVLRATLEVNLIGLIDFTERLIGKFAKNGQTINVSSRMGSLSEDFTNNPADNPSYRISKTALNMYTKTLAARMKKKGVTVSSVHPGWVKTYLGGEEAPRLPEEAANQIFKLATTPHETGKFWYDNKEFPW